MSINICMIYCLFHCCILLLQLILFWDFPHWFDQKSSIACCHIWPTTCSNTHHHALLRTSQTTLVWVWGSLVVCLVHTANISSSSWKIWKEKLVIWVIEILLFNAQWAIVSGISWGEQVTFQCDDTVHSLCTTPIPLVWCFLTETTVHRRTSHSTRTQYPNSKTITVALTNIHFIVFTLTWLISNSRSTALVTSTLTNHRCD